LIQTIRSEPIPRRPRTNLQLQYQNPRHNLMSTRQKIRPGIPRLNTRNVDTERRQFRPPTTQYRSRRHLTSAV
jgi:hypothetical protein